MNIFLDDIRQPEDVLQYQIHLNKQPIIIDERLFGFNENWKIVRNFNEFKTLLDSVDIDTIDLISFDHDLADEHYTPFEYWDDYEASKKYQESKQYTEKTGLHCAQYLAEKCREEGKLLPDFTVHSQNPVGFDNILYYLLNYKKHVENV